MKCEDNRNKDPVWNLVSYPIEPGDPLPPERKVVLVWLKKSALPFCGYVRYAAGDETCPYFVVYHGNEKRGSEVVAWCDCLPDKGPPGFDETRLYDQDQATGRGFAARTEKSV